MTNCWNTVPSHSNRSHCGPEIWTLNNSHPQAWELDTTGFEWSIAPSAKYASTNAMHFRTGGISGFIHPPITHPAVVRSPPVINGQFCNEGGRSTLESRAVSSQRQFEALETAQFLTFLPGFARYLAQTCSRQSAEASPATRILLLSSAIFFFLHKKSAPTCIITQSKDKLGDGQLNRNRFFLPSPPWSGSGRYFFPFTLWLSDRMTGDQQGRYFLKDSIKVHRLFTDLLSIEFRTPLFLHSPVWSGTAVSHENPQT